MAIDSTSKFFVLRLGTGADEQFIVCQSLVAIGTAALGGARSALTEELKKSQVHADVFAIPVADESRGWAALQAKIQVKPGPGGKDEPGGSGTTGGTG